MADRHPEGYGHPNGGDLYTPVTPEVKELFLRMRRELGTWRMVAWKGEVRLKVLRNMRRSTRKAISQSLLDRLTTGTGVGSIHEFTWFTAQDLVNLGIWEPVKFLEEQDVPHPTAEERELARRVNRRERRKARKRRARIERNIPKW